MTSGRSVINLALTPESVVVPMPFRSHLSAAALLLAALTALPASAAEPSASAAEPSVSAAEPSASGSAAHQLGGGAPTSERQRLSGFLLRPWGAALALGGGGYWLRDAAKRASRVGPPTEFGLDLRAAFLRVLFINAGFDIGGAPDHAKQEQQACSVLTGECDTFKTGIDTGSVFAKGGLLLRHFIDLDDQAIQTTWIAGIGYRGFWVTRAIQCGDCIHESLPIDAGFMWTPALEISWASNENGKSPVAAAYGLRFEYEYYVDEEAASSLWVKALLELM
jgi:hypothetical protein